MITLTVWTSFTFMMMFNTLNKIGEIAILLKSPKGLEWISVPVGKKTRDRLICEVEITQNGWQKSHWGKISQYYRKCTLF